MYALYLKELRSFLNSLIGYIAIIVFLVATGVFLWIFPGSGNLLDLREASLLPLFHSAPDVFLMLIPAITMRSFSEENRMGTIEILATKPIHDIQIVLAKYLASVTLVLFALIPTFIYYFSMVQLGETQGNIDHAGTVGGYIGLFLLGATFAAIGIYASSLSKNQVIAFNLGLLMCFLVYIGFQYMASTLTAPYDFIFIKLGIHEHYTSLQKGVIDSRDILYYLSMITFFILLTNLSLQSRKW